MFKINDYIMYGLTGVCKVMDITTETISSNIKKEYYVLHPVYGEDTIIKTPIDNKKISMRKIISKDDVISIINSMPTSETLWFEDEKIRNQEFKYILKSGKCEDLVKLIRSIYDNKIHMKSMGRKPRQSDDDIMKIAERLLNEEFATILNLQPNDSPSYISNNINI
ncbi:MAG: CarD family transcriptional regulator [Romboutsia sp.]|nr:CarD family transcriptional regulator [Romboutsia sp.]